MRVSVCPYLFGYVSKFTYAAFYISFRPNTPCRISMFADFAHAA